MTIDFALRRSPAYRVASFSWTGPWSDAKIRSNFRRVERWAKDHRLRTGKWIFRGHGPRAWEVAIEIRGSARPSAGIRLRTYRASRVASVTFSPDVVSPEVIYHGITDWLRWRRREKKIKTIGSYREVYDGDPWRNARAWARTTIQVAVRP